MPDEPFALSTMPSALPADMDYDALCAAVAATERGRWFLSEYARRNRSSDTAQVLAAIARMETAVAAERAQCAVQDADRKVHIELLEIARTIAQTRAEVAESRPELPPAAMRADAPTDVATAAERLRQIAWTLRACGIDLPISEQIAQVAESILSAQALRGLSEQRAQKLAEALHYLEQRIDRMLDSRRAAAPVPEAPQPGPDANGHAHGPTNGHANGHRHAAAPFALADIDPETAPDAAAKAAPSLQEPFAADADSAMMDAEESAAVKAAAQEAAAVVAAAEQAAEALAAEEEAAAVVAAAKEAAAVVAAAAPIVAQEQEEVVAQEADSKPTALETADDGRAQATAEQPVVAEEAVVAETTAAPEASERTPKDSEAEPETPDEPPPAVGAELPKPIRLVPSLDLDPPPVGRRPLAAQLGAAPAHYEAHEIQLERVEIEVVPLIAASAGGARAVPAMVQRITTEFVGLELSPPAVRPAVIVNPPAEPHTAEALSTKPAANQNLAARDLGTPELPAPSEVPSEIPSKLPSEAPGEALKPADQAAVDEVAVAVPALLEPVPTVVDAEAKSAEPSPTRADEAPTLLSRLPAATTADAIAMQVEHDLNALTDIAARADNPIDFLFLAPPTSAVNVPLSPPPKTSQLSNALAAIETELYAGAALASSTPPPPTVTVKPVPPSMLTGPLAALMAMSEEEKIALFS